MSGAAVSILITPITPQAVLQAENLLSWRMAVAVSALAVMLRALYALPHTLQAFTLYDVARVGGPRWV